MEKTQMEKFQVTPIGKIRNNGEETWIQVESAYIPALLSLDGFSHLQIIWWFSDFDNGEARSVLQVDQPYKTAPEKMGIFATRSPIRPNPVALTAVQVTGIDFEKGIIFITYVDANDQTPLLDIKPYTPSIDRVENPKVPGWCSHWPGNVETSGDFAWEDEFNF